MATRYLLLLLALLLTSFQDTESHSRPNLRREPRNTASIAIEHPSIQDNGSSKAGEDCLDNSEDVENCLENLKERQTSRKVITCLDNCANCVKQWKTGFYNGGQCANDCIQQFSNPIESLDPDCNLVKYFNSTILASV